MRIKTIFVIFSVVLTLIPTIGYSGLTVLIEDDFNDGVIDGAKWLTEGNYVTETGGAIRLVQNQTDAGGKLLSIPVTVNQYGLITLERRTKAHRANENFFSSHFLYSSEKEQGYSRIGHLYHTYYGKYGFGFWSWADKPYEYVLTSGVWDDWFTEVLTYNPVTGQSTYSINGSTPIAYTDTPLNVTSIQLISDTYGWFTGHYTEFDYIILTQQTNTVPVPASIYLLGSALLGIIGIRSRKRQ
jgi:hypothetical protein